MNTELKNRVLKDLILEKTWSIVGGLDGINIVRWTAGAEPRQKWKIEIEFPKDSKSRHTKTPF